MTKILDMVDEQQQSKSLQQSLTSNSKLTFSLRRGVPIKSDGGSEC